ncbi:hypothetical protein NSQ59_13495 [Margalitia sp. FSL K6-0131]|uniref:hypothetical protein n=1 Tax=Margalitia sp. FSL K6-0131 TaxID=2954604 RepID=UPI0030FC1EF6
MEIKTLIANMLIKNYQIEPRLIEQRPSGWSGLAFLVEDIREKYFLKVYDKKSRQLLLGLMQLAF